MPTLRTDLISHSQLTDGNASVLFDGTTDSITIPSTSAFAFGTGDWTVEMFVNFTSLSGQQTLVGDNYGNTAGWYLYKQSNNRLGVYYSSIIADGTATIEADRWYHLAFVRHNGITSIFIDGVMDATGADTTDATITQYYIGDTADQTSGEFFGYMSNLRITRTAVYKNNFTVPTFKLKEIPGTILLALQSSSSTTEAAVVIGGSLSANGDPTATAFGPGLKEDIKGEGVVFDGVTNFDTQDYLIPPRGTTAERNRGRGLLFGGYSTSPAGHVKTIQSIEIQSFGNTQDFGDLTSIRSGVGAVSSKTRAVSCGGGSDTPADYTSVNTCEFVTIANSSNTTDFGDLTVTRTPYKASSNDTRGIIFGGYAHPANLNVIDFITIATAGNATDFGDELNTTGGGGGSCSSLTRGFIAGGGPVNNIISFVTIATTGNAQDFGDLLDEVRGCGGCSNNTRGVFAGGAAPSSGTNAINFITMSSAGDATDFGDLNTTEKIANRGTSNSIRGLFCGGYDGGTFVNSISAINIATTGDAVDFGDITGKLRYPSAVSDSHGGLE